MYVHKLEREREWRRGDKKERNEWQDKILFYEGKEANDTECYIGYFFLNGGMAWHCAVVVEAVVVVEWCKF